MDRLRTRPTVPLDAERLQALALRVGTSLELGANCVAFAKALCTQLQLDYAAVWLHEQYLPTDGPPGGYVLAAAWPRTHIDATRLGSEHPMVHLWEERDVVSVAAPDPEYAACAVEQNLAEGTVTLLRLGDLGVLKLHDADAAPFVASAWAPLRPVLDHFTASLEQGIAHQQAGRTLAVHQRREDRLRQVIERLAGVVGSLHTGVLVEDDDLEVTLVNQAFCDLLDLEEAPEDLVGARRPRLIQRLRSCLARPDADLVRLGQMAQARQPVTGVTIALDDGRLLGLDYAPLDADGFRGHVWQYHAITPARPAAPLDAVTTAAPPVDGTDGGHTIEEEPSSFVPAALVRSVVEQVRETATAQDLALRVFVSEGLAPVLVAEVETLREVLHTLLHNAVRHTERGHVALTAVPVGRQRERVVVQFSVADSGSGIPRERLEHLFDPEHHPRLARAHQRIDAMGGDLSAQSVQGQGSVFTVVVPCRLPEAEPS
ncbi:MAG: PAS domain-containing protein [Bacteroidetes bacterium]|jgi:signal transduction histidine kinase|nr:PAS domain-containing protein [Bacteroidota bacterium]